MSTAAQPLASTARRPPSVFITFALVIACAAAVPAAMYAWTLIDPYVRPGACGDYVMRAQIALEQGAIDAPDRSDAHAVRMGELAWRGRAVSGERPRDAQWWAASVIGELGEPEAVADPHLRIASETAIEHAEDAITACR